MSINTPYRLFFSHGKEDIFFAEKLLKPRLEESGALVFLDAGEIEFGDDFREIIISELKHFEELLVLITPSSIARPWVHAEIGAAIVRDKRIIAITYGISESELQKCGLLSLFGNARLVKMDEFDNYIKQLANRVQGQSHE